MKFFIKTVKTSKEQPEIATKHAQFDRSQYLQKK
jgi:hypothetical protein